MESELQHKPQSNGKVQIFMKRTPTANSEACTLTCAGFRPELVAGLVHGVGLDVDDVEGVALVGEVVDGPLQGALAALGEIHGHADLSISPHLLESADRSAPSLCSWRTLEGKRAKRERERRMKG